MKLMTQQRDDELLTPEQAAGLVGISRRTLDRYADLGRIPKYHVGAKNVYYKRGDAKRLKDEITQPRLKD